MKKVLNTDLEKKFEGICGKGAAPKVIAILVELQDASGLKICTAVTKTDPAYREVK